MPKGKGSFGGYTVSFKGDKTTFESAFGKTPMKPSMMTKRLWNHIKKNKA